MITIPHPISNCRLNNLKDGSVLAIKWLRGTSAGRKIPFQGGAALHRDESYVMSAHLAISWNEKKQRYVFTKLSSMFSTTRWFVHPTYEVTDARVILDEHNLCLELQNRPFQGTPRNPKEPKKSSRPTKILFYAPLSYSS